MTTAELAKPETGFAALNLQPELLEALDRVGYRQPSPIQAAFIPHALTGRDVMGQAQTGTGKTAAFLLPFMNSWLTNRPAADSAGPQAIVLAPTRELVLQVAEEAQKLSPCDQFKAIAVIGGQRFGKQDRELREGCHILVGSPGRVIDHLRRGTLSLGGVKYAVLDEADRMLDIGFRPDMERILKRCPAERQTLLLSATLPDEVLRLTHRFMRDPLHVNVSPPTLTVDKIAQSYVSVDEDRKFETLCRLLDREKPRQCIIFCSRKVRSHRLYLDLKDSGRRAAVMHGDLPQSQRERIMAAFRARKVAVLIATDVVGRGIDVTGISHVINYDLPEDIENYVHRIGRTGRMGKDGIAISFVTPEQGKLLTAIEMTINRLIPADTIDGFEAVRPRVKDPEAEKPKASQPVFGRSAKKYSNRL